MLDLIGRLADGWVPSYGHSPPGRIPEMNRRIDEGAERAEREPREIRRVYNVSGTISAADEGPLEGPPSRWVETLTEFALEQGMDTFVFWPSGNHEQQVEVFATEVVPAVKEAVRSERP
jgi:alkanesulfonate monooxygenase SsuD/methylene tetrahydromethanopterin reductase-like flavin-dependent oxidoreductase (luciferase family)